MKAYSRALLILFVVAVFAALAPYFPELTSGTVVKYLSGIYVFVATLLSVFFTQLNAVTGVGVLSSKEMERYTVMRAHVRKRFWFVIAICLACSVVMWTLSSSTLSRFETLNGAAIGFLLAVGATYLLVVARWINDLSAFADRLRLIEQQRKEHEGLVKRLSDAAKQTG